MCFRADNYVGMQAPLQHFVLIVTFFQNFFARSILHPPPGHSPSTWVQYLKNLSVIRDKEEERETRRNRIVMKDDIRLIAAENNLGGKNRYVADGFLNSTECNLLIQLAQVLLPS